jgi:hypothetical protein
LMETNILIVYNTTVLFFVLVSDKINSSVVFKEISALSLKFTFTENGNISR